MINSAEKKEKFGKKYPYVKNSIFMMRRKIIFI